MSVHLVLVEPAGPLNVGSVARLCANFGLDGLRLVAPRCDPRDPEARRMAVHGLPLLDTALRFASLADALADCHRVVACTGRLEGAPLPLQDPGPCLSWLLADQEMPAWGEKERRPPAALVFGREDRGLSNDELLQAGRLLTLPTDPAYISLNLSHAVAIVLHELHGLRRMGATPQVAAASAADWGEAGGQRPSVDALRLPDVPGSAPARTLPSASAVDWATVPTGSEAAAQGDPCTRGELEGALADAEALLLEVGFLLPHTARARMAKVRALLQRACIRSAEVALLRGMVCQLRWASRRACPDDQHH